MIGCGETPEGRITTADEYIGDLEATIGLLSDENTEQGKALDEFHAIVSSAVSDLRSIEDVPLGDLADYVEAVVEKLREVLV